MEKYSKERENVPAFMVRHSITRGEVIKANNSAMPFNLLEPLSLGVIMLRIKMIVFVLILLISGTALAAPEGPETTGKIPAILFFPIVDNTGMKNTGYITEAVNAQYAKKYPAEKFTVIPLENYTNQVSLNGEPETEDKVIKAAAAAGADYAVRTDLQTIKIRRGFKGIFMKKWCAADIPVKITIWNVASGKTVFDGVIQERGDKTAALGGTVGLIFTVSEKSTVENGLKKLTKKMDKELPALDQISIDVDNASKNEQSTSNPNIECSL